MLKKIDYIKKFVKFVLAGLTIFVVFNCIQEEVQPPLVHNIQLTIKAEDNYFCKNKYTVTPADASIILRQETDKDTLQIASYDLGSSGMNTIEIDKSQFGISNLVMEARYKNKLIRQKFNFLCCDTLLNLVFNTECNPPVVFNCNNLDTTINLFLTNKMDACIKVGLDKSNMDNNRLRIVPGTRIRVDLNPAINMKSPFYTDPGTSFNPKPDGQGKVELTSQELSVLFYATANKAGLADTTINLPMECLNADGEVQKSGVLKIHLRAEICEDFCNCPFFEPAQVIKTLTMAGRYPLNKDVAFPNNNVVTISPTMLSAGCYLEIADIKRWDKLTSAATIPAAMEGIYDWTVTSNPVGQKLRSGETFQLSASFRPNVSGISRDTFVVYTNVFSDEVGIKDNTCSFLVVFVGEGCEDPPCPSLQIMKTSSDVIRYRTSDNRKLNTYNYWDVLPMDGSTYLTQDLTGLLGSLCTGIYSNAGSVMYNLFTDASNKLLCSAENIRITISGTDKNFFSYTVSNTQLSGMDSIRLRIDFITPSFIEYKRSNHGEDFSASLNIVAEDGSGKTICSQEIRLKAKVHEVSVVFSEPMLMKSFSQISDKESRPAYQVCKVDYYKPDYYYFGEVNNLNPALGTVNTSSIPHIPINNNNTFYFDVDEPVNIAKRQIPSLYLVNSSQNYFSQITTFPVATYSNNDAFKNDASNLINKILNSTSFVSVPGGIPFTFTQSGTVMWSPSNSAAQLSPLYGGKGVKLELGGVYVVWDPTGRFISETINGKVYKSFCKVALLYIDGISNGDLTNHHISNVSFLVAYPIN